MHSYIQKYIPPRLKSDLQNDRLPAVILLFGKEQLLINLVIDFLRTRYLDQTFADMDFVRLDGNRISVDELYGYLETLPLGRKKLVCISNAPHLYGDQKVKREGPKISHEELLKSLDDIPDHIHVILATDKVDKRKTLYKRVKDKGAYEFAGLDKSMLWEFISDRFGSVGKQASSSVISSLINLTGYLNKDSDCTLVQINNEISKIIAYAEGNQISQSDVTAVVGVTLNTVVFALTDAISLGKIGDALRILHDLLTSGSNTFVLLALLFSQFDMTLNIRDLTDRGFSKQDIQKMLSIDSYRFRILAGHAARFSAAQLRRIVKNAYEVEKNIKTGLLDQELALEMFIFEMGFV